MWTIAFWKATSERMLRGAAVAIFAVWFGGDVVFNTFDFSTWKDVGSLAVSGAFGSLLLALAGSAVGSSNGPSFMGQESLTNPPDGV